MSDAPTQGPKAGRIWPAEVEAYDDPNTGARVHRLTGYPGSRDRHPYFTEPCWYDDGRRLLVRASRDGPVQLFSVDLDTGLITQLTDLPEGFSSPTRAEGGSEVYSWSGDHLVAVDLDTLAVRSLYEKPSAYNGKIPGVNADGSRVCVSIVENVRDRVGDDWFTEKFEYGPHSVALSVPTDGGEAETLFEEDAWIGHVNPSPTRPELVTYCEEGPWHLVDNRIWVLNVETGERWKVREMPGDGAVGHEYWMADGERIGYHGREGSGDDRYLFAGSARYDDTDHRETEIPVRATHTYANSPELIVVDGSTDVPVNLLYRYDETAGGYEGPRMLATHDWGPDSPHPHSRLSPNDDAVVFDSDRHQGDSDVYVVEVPDFDELPKYGDGN